MIITTLQYEFSHGTKPKGFGSWAFQINGETKWFSQANYSEALKKAKAYARRELQDPYATIAVQP
ncbi:MAG: hypothetical protein NT140_08945 [Deltaproteobacteria bacterium]|nr:hypothetical protein [Deltaproteobacteria bacterium]